ncbi:hypothetical protein ACFLUZ_00900 [Chloroflexota bacterium]
MNVISCPICHAAITVKGAKGRKSNKPFIMLVCPEDGRHFRGFITDQSYVRQVLEQNSGQEGLGGG